jgi:hypothetical protein
MSTFTATPQASATQPAVWIPSASPGSFRIPDTPFADIGSSEGEFDWSPTGEWLLLRQGERVELIETTNMTVVRAYDVPNKFYADSTWIDSTSFFVYSEDEEPGHFTGTAWRGAVTSPVLIQTDIPWHHEQNGTDAVGLGNGKGAVAFESGYEDDEECGGECPRFQIWSDGSVSDEREGWPVAWSVDGGELAVIHELPDTAATPGQNSRAAGYDGPDGWLEVISYPDLQTVYANRSLDAKYDAAFNASGRYLNFFSDIAGHREVLDLSTQTVTQAPADYPIYWYGNDELVTTDNRDLIVYALDGSVAKRWRDIGDGRIGVSADGRLLVTTDSFRNPKFVNVIHDGQLSSFKLSDLPGLKDVNLVMPTPADDGRSSVLLTETPESDGPLLVLQVPD